MKRRAVLFLAVLGIMIALAALGSQKKPGSLLVLDWAAKASVETPPVAVLIELGIKDDKPTPWPGRATVAGAKLVHREGYRFRTGDKLVEPDGWTVSSHRGLRVPQGQPQVARNEGIATVGIVLQLADVDADAALTVERTGDAKEKVVVPLKDVLGGQPKLLWDGTARVRRISAAVPLVTAKTEDDFPAAAYGPDGTLWVAYISYTVKDDSRRIEQPQFKQQPADFKALYTPEFGDQLFVKYHRDGKWSEPIAVTGPKEDLVRCAIAADGDGSAWVVYSANRNGNYDLYTRRLDLQTPKAGGQPRSNIGTEAQLTTAFGPHLSPVMCTVKEGELRQVAYQQWNQQRGDAGIAFFTCQEGKWRVGFQAHNFNNQGGTLSGGGNAWYPALAAGLQGDWATVFDSYNRGSYDIIGAWNDSRAFTIGGIIRTARFEARPSLTYDAQGRLWIAYEEGPEKWGKDYGALAADKGNPLYNERSVRVVCLDGQKHKRPVAELPTSKYEAPKIPFEPLKTQQFEKGTRYAYPQIGIDGKGRVWLTYRQKFGSRYTTHPGSYWLTFARRLDGDKWSEPIEIHHSDGLLDHRPVLLPHKSGGLLVIHNTDGRYTTPEAIDNQIYMSYVDLPGEPLEPKLVPYEPDKEDPVQAAAAEQEAAAVKHIRDYRIDFAGKKLQLLRGEFHRHTEISWDGGPDGSLEDMFRYAIDSAAMDWIGNGDHDSGAGREYSWWLIQKFTDAYHVKDKFTPMFTYERSVAYPHGHRNCMFAKRGVRTLPRLAEPDMDKRVGGVHADDTKMLYRYLHELDGICAVHTSATSMGTDWRDNDPQVEPIVEVYQGDRMSYEHEEAPRTGYDPKSGKTPANVAGWFPKGFINHAFEKGYRLGFESSSDHWSTHISYCIVLAEHNDREAILAAVKQRHVYGATDDIIVDFRSGTHLMGDEFKTNAAPVLEFTVIGTKPLAQIDILKDSEVVDTLKPGKTEHKGTWTDPKPTAGTHYYYLRVRQADDELAWASPLWIDYAP